ncbi:hypothetical protein COO60DRAFT_1458807 [Scenedesmus sp. NREL 46B-D3]|nr:hypothetical protein COO60DRAFT_1458807 [Scenedesmus sp. NREL 46B-D3]
MKWSQCYTSLADPGICLPRFGHSAVCVNAKANWGSDLVVVYGGVGSAAGESAQTALGDVVVLQVDSGTWSAPDILPGASPGARAFHSAVAQGQRLLLFGGHILTFDAEHNRKRRTFFNDVWELGTQLKPEGPLPPPRKMHGMVKVQADRLRAPPHVLLCLQLGSQVVLFGGERDSGPLDDLWVLRGWQSGATPRWTQVKVKASPAPRFGHTLTVEQGGVAVGHEQPHVAVIVARMACAVARRAKLKWVHLPAADGPAAARLSACTRKASARTCGGWTRCRPVGKSDLLGCGELDTWWLDVACHSSHLEICP